MGEYAAEDCGGFLADPEGKPKVERSKLDAAEEELTCVNGVCYGKDGYRVVVARIGLLTRCLQLVSNHNPLDLIERHLVASAVALCQA